MINGRAFDWESIRIDAPWGLDVRILSITYSSDRPAEPVFGRGNVPRGYGRGNLTQDATIVVDAQAWMAICVFAGTQGGLLRIGPFPISASYSNGDQIPQNDYLPSCVFTKVEKGAAQGDTEIAKHTLTLKVLDPISYNLIPVA